MSDFDCAPLVEHLRSANLVAFVGAGASLSYHDAELGRDWPGLFTGAGLVAELAAKRSYIEEDMNFPDACFLYRKKESRGELERFLLEKLQRPAIQPLPAHTLLADIAFSAYITSNYDTLLESALHKEHRSALQIIEDIDVSRLRSAHTPVIKYHGCVSRPSTIIAARDEYIPLSERSPIIESLIKTALANKALLFVGFRLVDDDFVDIFTELKRHLKDYMPRSFVVTLGVEPHEKDYWSDQGLTIIEGDLTAFLRNLLRETLRRDTKALSTYNPSKDWINNAFFESLHKIRTLPSETQVVDAYLSHLKEEVAAPSLSLETVRLNAEKAASLVLSQRQNFAALRKIASDVDEILEKSGSDKTKAEQSLGSYIRARQDIIRRIEENADKVVAKSDSILLYSQSLRTIQLLKCVSSSIQQTCQLYVAECRPKSPDPFQDALAICEELKETNYDITIVPDSAIGNLLSRRQITKIIMGAHGIYCDNGKPHAFVNTCGSYMISLLAEKLDVPCFIIAEKMKWSEHPIGERIDVSYEEEEALFGEISSIIADISSYGVTVNMMNIGYDLCEIGSNTSVVSDG